MPLYSKVLFPFSAVWSVVLNARHRLFDSGLLKSEQSPIKTIVVGNLELGGTGKSQLTLFLLNQLKARCKLAVLSRGYGRKTTGYLEVSVDANADQVGDEPLMFKKREPEVAAFVCEDRLVGLKQIHQDYPNIELVILDDAFQHRKLTPDMAILTTDFNTPYFQNQLLPAGRLRDVKSRANAADFLVVTGCPSKMDEKAKAQFLDSANHWNSRNVYFSSVISDDPISIVGGNRAPLNKVWLVSGIAQPQRFVTTASKEFEIVGKDLYPDHHVFTKNDLQNLRKKLNNFAPSEITVLMTEKDASRINVELLKQTLTPYSVHYLPVSLNVGKDQTFIQKIIENVLEEDK